MKYAAKVEDGGTDRAFAGHGEFRLGSGDATIPDGTTLTTWTTHGNKIPDAMGRLIENGEYGKIAEQFPLQSEGARSWLPGAVLPDYMLKAPSKLVIMRNSMTVEDATPLSTLLQSNQGHLDWAACMEVRF